MTAKRSSNAAWRLALACIAASVAIAAPAAPCRSETAATSGSTAGYTQDTQAADATEQQDKSASDILGQCVAGITGVAYSMPSRTPFRSDGGRHSAVMADTVPR